jgi:hypothetical protein
MDQPLDQYDRPLRDLRISVTDRSNFPPDQWFAVAGFIGGQYILAIRRSCTKLPV